MGRPPRVLVAGGYTAGHTYAAIAIADAIRAAADAEILFVGSRGGLEAELVPAAGYAQELLWIGGLPRRLSARALGRALTLPAQGLLSAARGRRVLARFAPDVVVGVGGYVSGPPLLLAQLRGTPTVLLQADVLPGVTNRLLAPRATTVCLGMQGPTVWPLRSSGARVVFTGNPVRERAWRTPRRPGAFGLDTGRQTILVTGGSLGSPGLNASVLRHHRLAHAQGAQLLWQCGEAHARRCRRGLRGAPYVRLVPFIHDMSAAYAAADVVLSAAGALGIAELACAARPCVFTPTAGVPDEHQRSNAAAVAAQEAAVTVTSEAVEREALPVALDLLADPRRQARLAARLGSLARPDASRRIADEVLALVP